MSKYPPPQYLLFHLLTQYNTKQITTLQYFRVKISETISQTSGSGPLVHGVEIISRSSHDPPLKLKHPPHPIILFSKSLILKLIFCCAMSGLPLTMMTLKDHDDHDSESKKKKKSKCDNDKK